MDGSTQVFVAYDGPTAVATSAALRGGDHGGRVRRRLVRRSRRMQAPPYQAATRAWPDLPAMLIASDDGQPVYERLGYLRLVRWTCWMSCRRTDPPPSADTLPEGPGRQPGQPGRIKSGQGRRVRDRQPTDEEAAHAAPFVPRRAAGPPRSGGQRRGRVSRDDGAWGSRHAARTRRRAARIAGAPTTATWRGLVSQRLAQPPRVSDREPGRLLGKPRQPPQQGLRVRPVGVLPCQGVHHDEDARYQQDWPEGVALSAGSCGRLNSASASAAVSK